MNADERKSGYIKSMKLLDELEERYTDTSLEGYLECRQCFIEAREKAMLAGRWTEAAQYDERIEKLGGWIRDAEHNLEKRIRITEDRFRIAEYHGYPPPLQPWRYYVKESS